MATYEIKYRSKNVHGETIDHELHLESYVEYEGAIKACKKFHHKLIINPMCEGCLLLGKECNGEANHVYTGCVYRKVA